MHILGVRVDNFSRKEILEKIEFFLTEEGYHQVATVNPEFILEARKDEEFRSILNQSILNVADGVGIWYAFIRNFGYLKMRIAGVDLMHHVLQIANRQKLPVFLAINKHGLSSFDEIKAVLEKKYPNIEFYGQDFNPNECSMLHVPCSLILLCNFGAPQQEKFIFNQKSANIRIAMGVGGSFDFVTGKIKRAPRIMQIFGLEWLWRLAQEPKYRVGRIFRAVVVFPIRVLFNK